MNIKLIIFFFSTIVFYSCSENSTDIKNDNLSGVWKNTEEMSLSYIDESWIQTICISLILRKKIPFV